jgi:YidC/Oxa1 family membrane protein insertase
MDKNQVTGFVMIALLFVVYFTFFAPDPQEVIDTPATQEQVSTQPSSPQTLNPGQPDMGEDLSDSARQAVLSQRYGVFAPGFTGESQEVVLENKDLQITFDTRGGRIKSVWLKEFKTYDQRPLYLIEEDNSRMELLANTSRGQIDLKLLHYQPELRTVQQEDGTELQELQFNLNLGNGQVIKQVYSLPADEGFQLGYRMSASGLGNEITDNSLTYRWENRMQNFEHDLKSSRERSTINYYTVEEDYEELSRTGTQEAADVAERIKWAGMNHRFFTASVIADHYFENGRFSTEVPEGDTTTLKHARINLNIPAQSLQEGIALRYYFGPNNQRILNKVGYDFERNVQLGYFILRPINKWLIIPVFHFLERFFDNYGIIILLLVVFIKMLLFPLTYKSYVSMGKTRVLKPQLDEIKEKYGDDMTKVQQEQMKLYSQLGINPISGCVPMLLQMPILFAMFYFFPNSIELRQEGFLWANDLSTYDSIMTLPFSIPFYGDHVSLFTLLMAASTILMTMTNQQMSTVQGPMKTISYIMPITMLFFLNSFAAGLTYYYFLSNIITYGQQKIIRRFVDDEKIMATMEKNRLKNKDKKKSGFQARLEEAMKASQEAKKESSQARKSRKK